MRQYLVRLSILAMFVTLCSVILAYHLHATPNLKITFQVLGTIYGAAATFSGVLLLRFNRAQLALQPNIMEPLNKKKFNAPPQLAVIHIDGLTKPQLDDDVLHDVIISKYETEDPAKQKLKREDIIGSLGEFRLLCRMILLSPSFALLSVACLWRPVWGPYVEQVRIIIESFVAVSFFNLLLTFYDDELRLKGVLPPVEEDPTRPTLMERVLESWEHVVAGQETFYGVPSSFAVNRIDSGIDPSTTTTVGVPTASKRSIKNHEEHEQGAETEHLITSSRLIALEKGNGSGAAPPKLNKNTAKEEGGGGGGCWQGFRLSTLHSRYIRRAWIVRAIRFLMRIYFFSSFVLLVIVAVAIHQKEFDAPSLTLEGTKNWYPFVFAIKLSTQIPAVMNMAIMMFNTRGFISHKWPVAKFACVKLLVFINVWQSTILSLLHTYNVLFAEDKSFDSDKEKGEIFGNFLVCMEALILCCISWSAFVVEVEPTKGESVSEQKLVGFSDVVNVLDVWHILRIKKEEK